MVNAVSLEQVKAHLRITQNSEDSTLTIYRDAAEDYISKFLNQSIPGLYDSPAIPVPPAIMAAALLIVGDLYENREAQVVSKSSSVAITVNPTVMNLLYPYRVDIGI